MRILVSYAMTHFHFVNANALFCRRARRAAAPGERWRPLLPAGWQGEMSAGVGNPATDAGGTRRVESQNGRGITVNPTHINMWTMGSFTQIPAGLLKFHTRLKYVLKVALLMHKATSLPNGHEGYLYIFIIFTQVTQTNVKVQQSERKQSVQLIKHSCSRQL